MKKIRIASFLFAIVLFCSTLATTPATIEAAGPIYGIKVVVSSDKSPSIPSGYTKIGTDLNAGAGGKYIYLCYTRNSSTAGSSTPIKNIYIAEGSNASAPSGYTKINSDLNAGAGGSYLYLCYQRGSSSPITELQVLTGSNQSLSGYTKINTDLNKGAGGSYVYLYYKR